MVLFCDSFDVDRDTTSFARRYGTRMQTNGISFAQQGFEGGKSIQFSSLGPNNFETTDDLNPIGDTINVSLRLNAKRPRNVRLFVCGLKGSLLNQFEIFFARPTSASDDYFLRFFVGQTLIHETRVLDASTWHHLEFFGNVHPSVGTLSIRIDEVVEFQASNIQTANQNQAGWGRVGLGAQAENFQGFIRIADFIVADTIPEILGDRTAGFMGDVIVEHIWPIEDGIINLGTPSSGDAHYLMVDDSFFGTIDDDTTRITDPAALAFNIELFQMSEPIRVKGAILAAHVSADCKIDSGAATHIHLVGDPATGLLRIAGSANFLPITNTASYERKWHTYVANWVNPLKPWILANFRDLQWGYANLITSQPRCTRFFIEVVGYRHKNVVPLPMPSRVPETLRPIWEDGVRVTTAWQTTIRTEQEAGGEVRRALQRRPIRSVELTTTAINRDMATHALMAAARGGRSVLPIPLYSDHSKLTAAYTGGSTFISCDTLYKRFFPGQRLRILEMGDAKDPGLTTHVFTIATVTAGGITFTTQSVFGAPSFVERDRVYPLIDAEISLDQVGDLISDEKLQFATRILEVQGTSTLPPWWEGPIDSLYAMRARNYPSSLFEEDDAPIWDVHANWVDPVSVGLSRGGERYKVGKGFRTELDADRASFTVSFTVRFFNRFDAFRLIALHEWSRGSTRHFWLVNPQTTWEVQSYGTNQIIITAPSGGDIDDIIDLIQYVAITELTLARSQIWDIASVVDNGATWTINVVPNPLITFPTLSNTRRIAPAHNVRFASDELTESWTTDEICDFKLGFTETLDEKPAQILNAIPGSPKARPDQVPDLFFWFDSQRNIYTDRTFDPVQKAYVECVGWPHMDYKADVILDARAVSGKVIRASEGIPLPYFNNSLASGINPPYVSRDGVKLYGGGQRDIVNFEAYWGAAVEGGHPIEDNILWDNNKGMTLIAIVVQSSSGPFSTPQNWIHLNEDNPNTPYFRWDAAGRGPNGTQGFVAFYDSSGNVTQSMLPLSIDNWNFNGFSQRILPIIVRWDPNNAASFAYVIGGSAAQFIWTNHQSSIRSTSRRIQPLRWFRHMAVVAGDPGVEGSTLIVGQQAIRSIFGNIIMLKDFLVYKRALLKTEIDSIMAEFRQQYGNAFQWQDLSP